MYIRPRIAQGVARGARRRRCSSAVRRLFQRDRWTLTHGRPRERRGIGASSSDLLCMFPIVFLSLNAIPHHTRAITPCNMHLVLICIMYDGKENWSWLSVDEQDILCISALILRVPGPIPDSHLQLHVCTSNKEQTHSTETTEHKFVLCCNPST